MRQMIDPGVRETFERDVLRRSYKDGALMPLSLMALGLAGEWGELVEIVNAPLPAAELGLEMEHKHKIANEMGDVLWYAQAMWLHPDLVAETQMLPNSFSSFEPTQAQAERLGTVSVGKAVDAIKKAAWHGKPLDRALVRESLRDVRCAVAYLGHLADLALEYAVICNIEKLNKRYPGGVFVEGGGVRA